MEVLEMIMEEIGRVSLGLCGLLVLSFLIEGIDKGVKWVANRVNKIRKANSIRK
ncbi:hypothetical protein [Dethiothermospora halolimnae]|uniref:hypothetical protein n=1 Tax=Dethiothermospora halolimnae TaxID=3114390 RepID=UPI003CCB7F68